MEFNDHIWNHHEKCIQIIASMLSIDSLIFEIYIKLNFINVRNLLFYIKDDANLYFIFVYSEFTSNLGQEPGQQRKKASKGMLGILHRYRKEILNV